MFYVSDNKVYSDTFDEKLGVYPEVKIGVDSDGVATMTALKTGVAKKPKGRQVCTRDEVVAQLGRMRQKPPEPPASGK